VTGQPGSLNEADRWIEFFVIMAEHMSVGS
jgi:hypothetical protein